MDKTKRLRGDIYANGSVTDWQDMGKQLETDLYADNAQWRRFLNLLLPALGISFMVSGIIFFFAYNWTELDKFVKLGVIEGLLIITSLLALFTRWNKPVKQAILTGASFLVGALFAVYGQVYQTGANAYDFFLGWTIFVTIWTIAANYPPLWLLWIGLVNITIYLYREQTAFHDEELNFLLQNAHTLLCAGFVAIAEALHARGLIRQRTAWFIHTVALAAVTSITINAMDSILSGYAHLGPTLLITIVTFGGGLLYGFRKRLLFYIATIPFCVLLLLDTVLLQSFPNHFDKMTILLLGLVLVVGTTALVYLIIKLKKHWNGTTTA